MGLPDACTLEGQDGHAAEFICAVCFGLVDAPLLTRCNHIFCLACLQQWLDQKPSCPTCSVELDPRHGAGELRLASPLAWRVLGRLRVRCPLQGCDWKGEYSELMPHMTNSESHLGTPSTGSEGSKGSNSASQGGARGEANAGGGGGGAPTEEQRAAALQQAEALKNAGNSKFEQRVYGDALTLYSKAITLAPSVPTYLLNRAATYFNLGKYADAIDDCRAALRLDPTLTKGNRRLAKCHIELGQYDKAAAGLRDAAAASADAAVALRPDLELSRQLAEWQSEGESAMKVGEFSVARAFFANVLGKTSAPRSKLSMVRAELALGMCDRALRTCTELIKADETSAEAYVLRATALMYSSDLDQARKHLREALRLDPDDSEAGNKLKRVRKLEDFLNSAKSAYNGRDFSSAREAYSQALNIADAPQHAPLSATLHAERGATALRLRDFEAALKDCTVALYSQDDCRSAWVTKAAALQGLGRHEQALAELKPIMGSLGHLPEIQGAYNRAEFEVRKMRRPDYYAILRVSSIASVVEIKSAYKARALECHPDRHHDMSGEERAKAEEEFKLLGEALEMLADGPRL